MKFNADHFLRKATCNTHTGIKQLINHWTLSETLRYAQWHKHSTFSQCKSSSKQLNKFPYFMLTHKLRNITVKKKLLIAYCDPKCSNTRGGIWGKGREDKAAPGRHWSTLTSRSEKRREDYRDCLDWMGLDSGSLE